MKENTERERQRERERGKVGKEGSRHLVLVTEGGEPEAMKLGGTERCRRLRGMRNSGQKRESTWTAEVRTLYPRQKAMKLGGVERGQRLRGSHNRAARERCSKAHTRAARR